MCELDSLVANIVAAEELARELRQREQVKYIVQSKPVREKKYRTEKIELPSQTVSGRLTIASVKGTGRIREILIESDSQNMVIVLMVDGMNMVPGHSSLSDLENISPYLVYLDCFSTNGSYVVKVSNISFIDGFNLYIKATNTITIQKAMVIYDIFL